MDREIKPGAVVEFFEEKRLLCAVCLEVRDARLQVLTEQNKQANVASKRILRVDERPLDLGQGRAELLAALQEKVARRQDLMTRVSVEELWDLLREEAEGFDPRQLAEFCFSEEITGDHTSAVLRALLGDALYFKYRNGLFYPNSPERLEQVRLQLEREAQKERELAESSTWLAAVWRGETGPAPENRDRYIRMIMDLYLHGPEAPTYQQAKTILSLAQIPLPHGAFQILVKLGAWREDENLYFHRFGIQETFPQPVMNAADRLEQELAPAVSLGTYGAREDLTALGLLTIDGPMTRDYDDALSVRTLDHGTEVGIHIADAAEFVACHDPLDEEALERATSLYLPDSKIPMLPPLLSEGVCSLKQGENRLALSLLIRFDQEDRLLDYRFTLSRVRVHRQLTYTGANDLIATDGTLGYLFRLATRLRRQRVAKGALHLPLPELRIWVNSNGIIHISRVDRETPSQVVVSELMILANALAAAELAARGVPAIYRSQEKPQEVVFDPDSAGDDLYLKYRQRRFLSRAELGIAPKPHNSLGMEAYTSWTSPIRRYVDLVVQRQLKSMALGAPPAHDRDGLGEIVARVVLPQSRAQLMKRQWTRYWVLKYLERERIKTLDALVLDQGARNYYLLLPDYLLEASMPLAEGRRLKPGDHFRVEIVKVDPREDVLKLTMG
jgi:exoribonuclease II